MRYPILYLVGATPQMLTCYHCELALHLGEMIKIQQKV